MTSQASTSRRSRRTNVVRRAPATPVGRAAVAARSTGPPGTADEESDTAINPQGPRTRTRRPSVRRVVAPNERRRRMTQRARIHDEDPDTEGRTVPPYEGRRESADVDGAEEASRGDAQGRRCHRSGRGATSERSPDPADTERGAHGLPCRRAAGRVDAGAPTRTPRAGPSHDRGRPRPRTSPEREPSAGRRHRQPLLRRRRVRSGGRPALVASDGLPARCARSTTASAACTWPTTCWTAMTRW